MAQRDLVLMYVDFPHAWEGKSKVKDAARNEALGQRFQVKDFPTVVLVGKQQKPIGVLPVHQDCDLKGFLALLKEWRHTGDELQRLTKEIEAAGDKAKKNDAVCKAWDLVMSNDLDRYYEREIEQWKGMLPAEMRDHKPAATAAEVERWKTRLEQYCPVGAGGSAAIEAVAEFDKWKATRSFPDHEAAAHLYWLAAVALMRSDQFAAAVKKCDEGLKFDPTDEHVRAGLEQLKEFIADKSLGEGEHLAGNGTGYFIARGGYLLTNHHVVHKNKKIKVRMVGHDTPFPAKVLASDANVNIALVKAEIPADIKVTPVPIIPGVKAGQPICVMGFPTTGNIRANFAKMPLVTTAGIISGLPESEDNESFIQLDCRVNPGNSGGPLFNNLGVVVGMIAQDLHFRRERQRRPGHPRGKTGGLPQEEPPRVRGPRGPKTGCQTAALGAVAGTDVAVRRMRTQLPIASRPRGKRQRCG